MIQKQLFRSKPRLFSYSFFLILFSLFPIFVSAGEKISIVYIANEGVLISSGDDQVLIDAIHKPYKAIYLHTNPATIKAMHAKQVPFHSLDFILVSHVHRDHLHAGSVANILQTNPETLFFSSPQAVDSLMIFAQKDSSLRKQLKRSGYETGVWSAQTSKNIQIRMSRIGHGTPDRFGWIQNMAHLISLRKKKILHVGDPTNGEADFRRLHLEQEVIDVAILPYWLLIDKNGRSVIEQWIKPRKIIAVHIPLDQEKELKRLIAEFYPNAIVFIKPGEIVTL